MNEKAKERPKKGSGGRAAADPETGLTPKQEAFCVALVKTGNASEAYRQAYDAENMKPETIARTAHELQHRPKIATRVEALRKEARKASKLTLEEHMRALAALRNAAAGAKQFGPAVSAEVSRGRAAGLYDRPDEDDDVPAPVQVVINVVDGRKAG